jgi:hypothetical protein
MKKPALTPRCREVALESAVQPKKFSRRFANADERQWAGNVGVRRIDRTLAVGP